MVPATKRPVKPPLDFLPYFRNKLEHIPPFDEEEGIDEAWGFEDVGVTQVKRTTCVLVFSFKRPADFDWESQYMQLDMWHEDPRNVSPFPYSHDDCREKLLDFLGQQGIGYDDEFSFNWQSGQIIEDQMGRLHLYLNEVFAEGLQKEANAPVTEDDDWFLDWEDLFTRYGIYQAIGRFRNVETEGDSVTYGRKSAIVLHIDKFGQIRDDMHVMAYAAARGMNLFQFIRFRLIAQGVYKNQNQLLNWDRLADDIMRQAD